MEFLGIRTKSGAIVQPNSGEEMIRKFDFAYSTPGLTTGVVVYNPTVGDILLDAWIEVDTAFNGTTPLADISQFNGGNFGWFGSTVVSAVDLTRADGPNLDTTGVLSGGGEIHFTHTTVGAVSPIGPVLLSQAVDNFYTTGAGAFTDIELPRIVPLKFTNGNPVKLVVSQTGLKGGAATGATQGAGTVYFLTGTPQ